METLTPRVLELIEAIRRAEPESINETARVVDPQFRTLIDESINFPPGDYTRL